MGMDSRQVRIFLDTEFTGLEQRWPRLISIGLVSENRQHSFYAELPLDSYVAKCSPWVLENVLPHLEGGDHIMQPTDLQQRLSDWIKQFGTVRIATDAQNYDFKFLRSILDPWPENIYAEPLPLTMNYLNDYDKFTLAMEESFAAGLRRHHALDDAKANRLSWIVAGGDIEKHH